MVRDDLFKSDEVFGGQHIDMDSAAGNVRCPGAAGLISRKPSDLRTRPIRLAVAGSSDRLCIVPRGTP